MIDCLVVWLVVWWLLFFLIHSHDWGKTFVGVVTKYFSSIIDFIFFQISDGFGLRLQIWDTAGQERFRCLIPSYLRDCHVILVCFDVTNCCTLDNVPDWIELAQKERFGRIKKPLIVLVGNKVDEKSQRQVSTNHDVEFKGL